MGLSTPAKVGLLTIVGLIALGIIIVWKTEIFMVSRGYEMIGSFPNVEGLSIGAEVRYRGFKVGKIMRFDAGPYDIKVYSVIKGNIKIPDDSTLRIGYDGIVGLKYLEIRPGTSEVIYSPPAILYGVRTAGIVDFIDIGAQNLQETKAILEQFRLFVGDPELQASITNTVLTANKVATDLEKLTNELRSTNLGIQQVVTDPKFQENVKGTIAETEKTLSSANRFFEGVGKMNLRASAGVDVGSNANAVKGNVDFVRGERDYLRLGIGEGPSRQPSLLDLLFVSKLNPAWGYRLGVINNQIGGGLILYPSTVSALSGDIYDVNNPRPNAPRVRIGYEHELQEYMDLMLKADDILNSPNRNFTIGIMVKPPGEKVF
jgi:phospholipid/cholesterol/gamma-HCH transport system substrate-binding protein